MKRIRKNLIIPSSAYILSKKQIRYYEYIEKAPEIGDVIYGQIIRIGQHSKIENKNGRLHNLYDGLKTIFVFGNRYATDYYEGIIPDSFQPEIDMISRSGVICKTVNKNTNIKDPTIIKILGYVLNENEEIVNTRKHFLSKNNRKKDNKDKERAKLILNIGTSMNAGKSMTAATCCRCLKAANYSVMGSKITGTASLKDILNMQDSGAETINDFTFLGFPSTYLLEEKDLLDIFKYIENKCDSSSYKYWIVEIADGVIQRETAILLKNETIRKRIHKLILSTPDCFSAIGGTKVLKEKFDLVPDAISGVCSSSPLGVIELKSILNIPVFDNINPVHKELLNILE